MQCFGESLHYDIESGYLVIKLDSGQELWISSDYGGFHVLSVKPVSPERMHLPNE